MQFYAEVIRRGGGGGGGYNTGLAPPLCTEPGKWSVVYLVLSVTLFACFYNFDVWILELF